MKTKPFNLERALAGDPVITVEGRKVLSIYLHNVEDLTKPLSVVIESTVGNKYKHIVNYTKEGRYYPDMKSKSEYDLVMLDESVDLSGCKFGDRVRFSNGETGVIVYKQEAMGFVEILFQPQGTPTLYEFSIYKCNGEPSYINKDLLPNVVEILTRGDNND